MVVSTFLLVHSMTDRIEGVINTFILQKGNNNETGQVDDRLARWVFLYECTVPTNPIVRNTHEVTLSSSCSLHRQSSYTHSTRRHTKHYNTNTKDVTTGVTTDSNSRRRYNPVSGKQWVSIRMLNLSTHGSLLPTLYDITLVIQSHFVKSSPFKGETELLTSRWVQEDSLDDGTVRVVIPESVEEAIVTFPHLNMSSSEGNSESSRMS